MKSPYDSEKLSENKRWGIKREEEPGKGITGGNRSLLRVHGNP